MLLRLETELRRAFPQREGWVGRDSGIPSLVSVPQKQNCVPAGQPDAENQRTVPEIPDQTALGALPSQTAGRKVPPTPLGQGGWFLVWAQLPAK